MVHELLALFGLRKKCTEHVYVVLVIIIQEFHVASKGLAYNVQQL